MRGKDGVGHVQNLKSIISLLLQMLLIYHWLRQL